MLVYNSVKRFRSVKVLVGANPNNIMLTPLTAGCSLTPSVVALCRQTAHTTQPGHFLVLSISESDFRVGNTILAGHREHFTIVDKLRHFQSIFPMPCD